jgi:arsenical pump membrane protein
VLTGTGAISLSHARAEAGRLGPVIGFLAAVLVLARLCDDEGLFRPRGAWMARSAAGRPRRLLAYVFAVASVIAGPAGYARCQVSREAWSARRS